MSRRAAGGPRPGEEPPAPLARNLFYLLKHAQLRLAEATGPALAPFGIDGRELAVLVVLADEAPLSQQQAASRLGLDRTTMVAMIDALEGKGLVERRPDPADRRRNIVEPTAEGRETLRKARRARDDAERRFLAPLGDAEVARLEEALRALAFPPAAGHEPADHEAVARREPAGREPSRRAGPREPARRRAGL